ncbi:MAG: hypothetical protein M1827_001850 [Pycnora praestabilis]|nr:MAG: hypothetical protein M1827_001850 [Pycnora praestabilis]
MATNPNKDLVLITCASGKQCSHLLPLLVQKWKHLRLVVNSSTSEQRLKKQYTDAEVIKADLADPHETRRIFQGVTAVYHVGPSFHPHETEIGYNMIDAALASAEKGILKHFVYSSVLDSQIRKLTNHDCKRYVEEYLIESGLPYTILQPTHFMDTFPVPLLMSQESPVYSALWNPKIEFSYIALRDLGEASARVLEQRETHLMAIYPLVGTSPPMSYNRVCEIVSHKIGKQIKVTQKPFDEAVSAVLIRTFGTEQVHPHTQETAQRMLLYYSNHGLIGNPNVLQWLLGRKPTSYDEWTDIQVQLAREQ